MGRDEKRVAVFIEGNRTGYGPEQVEDRTMTVADLIDVLTEMGEAYGMDAKVFLRNDRGYTYGEVNWDGINHATYDDHRVYWGGEDYEDGEEW